MVQLSVIFIRFCYDGSKKIHEHFLVKKYMNDYNQYIPKHGVCSSRDKFLSSAVTDSICFLFQYQEIHPICVFVLGRFDTAVCQSGRVLYTLCLSQHTNKQLKEEFKSPLQSVVSNLYKTKGTVLEINMILQALVLFSVTNLISVEILSIYDTTGSGTFFCN